MVFYGLLQSPTFLYREELGEARDGSDERRYTDLEMASRLAFFLWDTSPDDALLDAAVAGELTTEAEVYAHAARLLEAPRARAAVRGFFAQYLDLGRLDGFQRDPALYPAYSDTLAQSMRTEVGLLVDDLVFRSDADVRGLLSSRRSFVNEELAALYGIDAPGATPVAYVPVDLPPERIGFLTSGAFLALNARLVETSPTLRGKFVRERLLCQTVPQPDADVDLAIEEPSGEARTLRERLEQHVRDPACAGCHEFTDPPGYLFESFDAIGAYRTEDNGVPIDASGGLDGVPMAGAADLGEALAADPRVAGCMVTQLFRHANGRVDLPGEAPALAALERAFADSGYRFQDLLLELAVSSAFRTVAAPEVSP